jgi:3-deoxy-D-manno-octulosonate 8-phosphate phosphatase (KDO 8-P phosphatase)
MKHLSQDLITKLSSIKCVVFDFDGVFTDNTVTTSSLNVESVSCWRSDGLGLSRLRSIKIPTLILSSETNPVVSLRAKKLNIPCIQGIEQKDQSLRDISQEYQIKLSEIAYLGNDINDIPAFKIVGLAVAVKDAYPEVLPYVSLITERQGGRGAVREICDLIYQIKSQVLSQEEVHDV